MGSSPTRFEATSMFSWREGSKIGDKSGGQAQTWMLPI
jgi:hypothetical protein